MAPISFAVVQISSRPSNMFKYQRNTFGSRAPEGDVPGPYAPWVYNTTILFTGEAPSFHVESISNGNTFFGKYSIDKFLPSISDRHPRLANYGATTDS
jgi:hypothetical protein